MNLTIFEISYLNPDPKKGEWLKLRIAAPSLKAAVDEAINQKGADFMESIVNIQNTRQILDGVALPVAVEPAS
jgi:hypothetical protein